MDQPNQKKGNIKFVTIKAIDDFQMVAGKSVTNVFPMHIHQKYCIGLLKKGNALLVLEGNTFRLSENDLYFINAGESHQIKPAGPEGFDHLVFCFGLDFKERYFSFPGDIKPGFNFNKLIVTSPEIRHSFCDFFELTFKAKPPLEIEYLNTVFYKDAMNFIQCFRRIHHNMQSV